LGEVTYCAVTKNNFNPYTFKNFIDATIFFIAIFYIILIWGSMLKNTFNEGNTVVSWNEKSLIYARNYKENVIDEHALLVVSVILLWIRVINFFRYNEYLGKFIGVVR